MKHVGIRYAGVPTSAELLLFDEIAVYTLGCKPCKTEQDESSLAYLVERGVVVGVTKFVEDAEARRVFHLAMAHVMKGLHEVAAILEGAPTSPLALWPSEAEKQRTARQLQDPVESFALLPCRYAVERTSGYRPATIVCSSAALPEREDSSRVLEVVMRQMPTLAADTPLEAVLDFRADDDAMRALRRLRHWMNAVARESPKPHEIEEAILTLSDQYREHMRLHKMRHGDGLLRVLVTVPADVLEHLLRLKLSSALESALSFRERKLALTEAEMNAPGRDVAYIVRAQDAFAPRNAAT